MTPQSLTMDQPGLGFLFDCCLDSQCRPFTIAVLLLETYSVIYCSFNKDTGDQVLEKTFYFLITLVRSYVGIVCSLASLVWLNCNQKRLNKIITDLNRLKTQLNICHSPRDYLQEWFVVFSIVFIILGANGLKDIRDMTHLCVFLPHFFTLLFSYLFIGQVSCLFIFVKSMYSELLNSKKYEDSVVCCQVLSKIVDDICELYKLPIVLNISWLFFLATCNVYVLLHSFFLEVIWSSIVIIIWSSCYVYPITLIIRSCNGLNEQVKKFNEYLYWRMVEDESRQLLNSEKLDLHFIQFDEMAFSACDFFPIDNSLICSMISVATTYLVILLQYEKDDSSHYQAEMNTTISSD